MTCRHLTDPMNNQCCAAGVDYLRLTGGGVYSMVLRLPCVPITDRKGNEMQRCGKFQVQAVDQVSEAT